MIPRQALQVVWFKRDLRVHDHAALCGAQQQGPVLAIFAIEPSQWERCDAGGGSYGFMIESLRSLQSELAQLNIPLWVRVTEVTVLLEQLRLHSPAGFVLHSLLETGHGASFARDKTVARWCRNHGVVWQEWPNHGVFRVLRDRDGWALAWQRFMQRPCLAAPVPQAVAPALPPAGSDRVPARLSRLRTAAAAGFSCPDMEQLARRDPPQRQRGGRDSAWAAWRHFVDHGSKTYRWAMSSPLTAFDACSRLSPYLSWGCVSVREVWQAVQQELGRSERGPVAQGLRSLASRLQWHDHFIQKMESEPELEWRNLHRGHDGLRNEGELTEPEFERWRRWALGLTGWPLVDACQRALHDTGWMNFRMRAMLASSACHLLWLHWRSPSIWLATQFVDYEPGIHYPQFQMQSGTTGINTLRVYNPIKQALEHDTQGAFIRHWVPELRELSTAELHRPWLGILGVTPAESVGYPIPMVDLEVASREALDRITARRRSLMAHREAQQVYQRHGSRRRDREGFRARPREDASDTHLDQASSQASLF